MSPSTSMQAPERIDFPNGNQAQLIIVRPAADAGEIVRELKLEAPRALILIASSALPSADVAKKRLQELFSRGVASEAAKLQAVIIDNGVLAELAELMGLGVADRDGRLILLGVAPLGEVALPPLQPQGGQSAELDPNHSHFVLVEIDRWGGETRTRFSLAKALSAPHAQNHAPRDGSGPAAAARRVPTVMVLAGGDENGVAMQEALGAVRHGWPLVVIEGSGGLADKIAQARRDRQRSARRRNGFWGAAGRLGQRLHLTRQNTEDPELAEILGDGAVQIFPQGEHADKLSALLKRLLVVPPESVLRLAWRRFAEYDANTARHQKWFRRYKNWPLMLGVLTTFLALLYSQLPNSASIPALPTPLAAPWTLGLVRGWIGANALVFFRWIIIALPIVTSVLLALDTRFKPGSKYLKLRAAAEAIKRGIYSYRVIGEIAKGDPSQLETDFQSPQNGNSQTASSAQARRLPATEEALAKYIDDIALQLMRSEVNESALRPWDGDLPPPMYGAEATDDGISPLSADEYIRIRLGDQISYYTGRTDQMERGLRRLQVWMVVFGAIGAFLAAIGLQYWLPLTAAFVSALTGFVEYQQIEQVLVKYNYTRSSLENLRIWWRGLPQEDKKSPHNLQRLVRESEAVLEAEIAGWVQYLNAAQNRNADGNPPGDGSQAPGTQSKDAAANAAPGATGSSTPTGAAQVTGTQEASAPGANDTPNTVEDNQASAAQDEPVPAEPA